MSQGLGHNSAPSMANLWVEDGGSTSAGSVIRPITKVQVVQQHATVLHGKNHPVIISTSAAAADNNVTQDLMKYYKDTGMEHIAKDAGLIDSSGKTLRFANSHQKNATVIAVPVASDSIVRQSPLRSGDGSRAALQVQNSPMIVSTPQRGNTWSMLGSPPTPSALHSSPMAPGYPSLIRKRSLEYPVLDADYSDGKRRRGEKGGKGLRHFSMKVCEKVQRKGTTSYNEVADELVAEFSDPHRAISPTDQAYDQKNIRRRVYDALNVLMAMNIISKEKKEIKWLGLPTNSAQECNNLEIKKQQCLERIRHKTQQMQELIIQQIAFKNVVQRNREVQRQSGPPAPNSAIHLPFIIVSTSKKTVIDCSISNDKYEYLFNFDNTFEIHDDIEVLKRMNMAFGLEKGQANPDDIARARAMVPKALEHYVLQMADGSMSNVCTSIVAGPTGVSTGPSVVSSDSLDTTDVEVATVNSLNPFSRQSSDSFSRAETETPSDDSSDSESSRSTPVLEIQ